MTKKRRVVRDYPDDWPSRQEGLFLSECRKQFGIPAFTKAKFRKLRLRRLVRVTWEWEVNE